MNVLMTASGEFDKFCVVAVRLSFILHLNSAASPIYRSYMYCNSTKAQNKWGQGANLPLVVGEMLLMFLQNYTHRHRLGLMSNFIVKL